MTSQGYAWLSQQAWFVMPELALPWVLLGGMGLAIASNRHEVRDALGPASRKPVGSSAIASKQPLPVSASAPQRLSVASPEQPPQTDCSSTSLTSKPSSISFEIPNKRMPSKPS